MDTPADKSVIQSEQLRQLFSGLLLTIITGTVLAAIIANMMREVVGASWVADWFALVVTVALARIALMLAYRRAAPIHNPALWLQRFRFGAFAAAAVWGGAGVLLFPAHDVMHQAFLAFVLTGLAAGGAIAYAVDINCAIPFVLVALLPFMFRLFGESGEFSTAMGMAVALFIAFVVTSLRRIYQGATENIVLQITATQRANALYESETKLHAFYDSTSDALMLLDEQGFFDCNKATLKLFGCTSLEQFCARHPADLSPPTQPCGTSSQILAEQHIATAMEKGSHRFEWMHQRADTGETFPAEVLLNTMQLHGKQVLHATVRDISERKQTEHKIHQLAFYDALTNMPNRRLLLDRLRQAFAVSARNGRHGAILFMDLDNFKTLNDTKGHDLGDLLLIEIARRLGGCVRDGDTVARLGGDEFVVVLECLSEEAVQAAVQAELVADKIITSINQPYDLASYAYHTTCSIGICAFLGNAMSVDELLKRADTAMYQAKQAGRNALRFFDPATQIALEARMALESDLRGALARQQLHLYYQMQVDRLGQIIGAEVLLRWLHPARGLVSPQQFIPLAEENGLILPIGQWVLETACRQIKTWQADPRTAHLQLAVNISARQFRQPDFVVQICEILEQTGSHPSLLKLELTESVVLDDVADTIAKMQMLKQIGVRFSMDDFGTGYSSLSYLTQLPLDQLKIDQSFVRNIGNKTSDATIVKTIIGMANNLAMEVIAEGVETQAQRDFLELAGCLAYQGYLFGKPIPLAEFAVLLTRIPPGQELP